MAIYINLKYKVLGASKVGVADVLLRICPEANSQIGIWIAPYKTLDIGNLLPPNQYCDTILPQGVVYESFSY